MATYRYNVVKVDDNGLGSTIHSRRSKSEAVKDAKSMAGRGSKKMGEYIIGPEGRFQIRKVPVW